MRSFFGIKEIFCGAVILPAPQYAGNFVKREGGISVIQKVYISSKLYFLNLKYHKAFPIKFERVSWFT